MQTALPLPLLDPAEGVRLCAGNAQLYQRMLERFLTEPTMGQLIQSIEHGDLSSAFLHAHTLKGLCAQLALPALSAACSTLCDLLRTQDAAHPTQAQVLFERAFLLYGQTLAAIRQYLAGNSSPTFVF